MKNLYKLYIKVKKYGKYEQESR